MILLARHRCSRARHCAPLLAWLLTSCQLMVGSDVERVECAQEGLVGPPACREGESCQQGVCRQCLARELCGDELDNDCDGTIDDGCGPDGGAGAPAAIGGAGGDEVVTAGSGTAGDHHGGEAGAAGGAGALAGSAGSLAGGAGSSGVEFGGTGQGGEGGASGSWNRGQRP